MKNRIRLNFIIDLLMFLVMMAVIGIGLLIKYVLVPGSRRWDIYVRNVDLTLWGWDRHQWGTVHLILGAILSLLLVLHIVFHWRQIVCMYRQFVRRFSWKLAGIGLFLTVSFILLGFSFVVDISVTETDSGHGDHHQRNSHSVQESEAHAEPVFEALSRPEISDRPSIEHAHQHSHHIDVRGSMTLAYLHQRYGVSADSMKAWLNLPPDCPEDLRLGQLCRKYNLEMQSIRILVEQKINDNSDK